MSESSRKIEFDIEALLLSAVCVFLWLSLLSFNAADDVGPLPAPLSAFIAVDASIYPPNEEIQNACGWFGALTANVLVQCLGFGSFLVATGLSVLAIWMFRVQSNYVRAARQIGWVLIIVAATAMLALLKLSTPMSPVIGPGGYLGAITATWLNEHFAVVGSMILTMTVLIAGLLLSTDYLFVRATVWMLLGGASLATSAAAATKSRVSLPAPRGFAARKSKSDVEEGVVLGENSTEHLPPVKIRGKGTNEQSQANSDSEKASGLLSTAASLVGGLLAGKSPAPVAELDVEEELEEEDFEEEFFAAEDQVEEEESTSELRDIELDGEVLHLRNDEPEAAAPAPAGPKVRPPKNNKQAEKQALSESLAHLDDTKLPAGAEEYVLPGIDMLLESDNVDFESQTIEVRRKAKILESTFKDFGFNVKVVEIETGPVIAQYEIELEAGLRLAKITSLADDLAIALRVPSVRIVAPIPGKNTVGIEVPNETRQVVRLREVIEEMGDKGRKAKIPLFLGKDVSGNALTADLATLPHLLIAGRTGTGKSVCLNAIIASILMTRRPDEVRMLMIDPKMVELSGYGRLPHLMHPVVTDMKKAEAILAWAVDKMEERYALLARAGVRHITSYNELGREELLDRLRPDSPEEAEAIPDHLPFIVIVADEMADLMMTAGKEVEQHIIRLAQKSRAVGIHLILATQKPTVDVITGLIKSNLPARIAFQVASRTDSRVVLDEMGADKLLGNGDMLFLWPGTSMLLRGQGTYLSDEEINAIVDHCSTGEQNFVNELVNLKIKDEEGDEVTPGFLKKRDDLYAAAVDVVVREGRGSCSLLQRALGIGYGRAARLIDYMAEDGIVGQYNGSQAREVVISIAEWEAMQANGEEGSSPTPASPALQSAPRRTNKIRPDATSTAPAAAAGVAASPKPAARVVPTKPAQATEEVDELPWESAEDVRDEDLLGNQSARANRGPVGHSAVKFDQRDVDEDEFDDEEEVDVLYEYESDSVVDDDDEYEEEEEEEFEEAECEEEEVEYEDLED